MPVMSQKFKFGSIEMDLDLVSSGVPNEPQFIYIDDILEAFKIPDADSFEADGRTIAYVEDDSGTIPSRKSAMQIQEFLELQKQMNDRLILIQSKIEAILTQQLELGEHPTPWLFIVLPENPAKYDPGNWFRTKFRLHFICECGEHTKAGNSKLPHHLHLAKHEGYLICEPAKLFKKYGPFLLLMLELFKFGLADSVKQNSEVITAIDYSLECINRQLVKAQVSSSGDFIETDPRAAMTYQDLTNYLSDVKGLESVELRQLGSFLKTSKKENLLGNLYQMTTSDGHIKWVCHDHYRVSYQETHVQRLRDVVQLALGEFDEQLGRITITLTSSLAATDFYHAIMPVKSILELDVDLGWACDRHDLEVLEDVLRKSRLLMLRLDLQQFRLSPISKLLPTSMRYKGLARIMEHPCMKLIHIVLPEALIKNSDTPSHLHKLSFGMVPGSHGVKGFGLLPEVIRINPGLTTLDLQRNSIGDRGAQALSEALKTNSALTTLFLYNNSIGDNGAQALSEALKTNSTLTTLSLESNSVGDNGAQALAEALKTNSTLTTLNLESNSIWFKGLLAFYEAMTTNSTLTILHLQRNEISDNIALALSEALKTNSSLTTLDLQGNLIGDDGAQALSEALKTNSTLATLYLGTNSIEGNGAQALAEALKINSTLTTLDLWRNSIGDNGAQALAEALKTNSTLTTLDLWGNSIRDNGAQVLSDALKTDSTLATLYLGTNSIGDNGAQALAEALKTNSNLTTLDLWSNSIGDSGAQALAEALKTNLTLTTLDLWSNSIGDNGAQALHQVSQTSRCHIIR
ncbi:hypothetical protein CPC16_011079 [Podila verticillata]|nr:hypothetical protein CPC16_011079 [Podila verticillata]